MQGGRSVSAGWTCEAGHHLYNVRCQVDWQPSRFLTDRAEADVLSSWPSSSAASMPPRPSSAPPGRRCAKPSPATASACRPATPKPPPARHRRRPPAYRDPRQRRPLTRCLRPSTRAPSPPARVTGRAVPRWVRRDEEYATPRCQRGGRAVQRKPRLGVGPSANQTGDCRPGLQPSCNWRTDSARGLGPNPVAWSWCW
jgi:hypothetical protein